MSMMIAVPGTTKGIDEEEAPLESICRMNVMIKSLINKVPLVELVLWIPKEGIRLDYWNSPKIWI